MYPSYVQSTPEFPLNTQSSPGYAPHTQSTEGYATYPQPMPYYARSTHPYVQYMPGYPPYQGMIPTDAHGISDSSSARRDQRILTIHPHGEQRSSTADEKPNPLRRPLKEPQVDHANIKRRETTDWEERKSPRRLRYTIPLRSNKNILWDEENAVYGTNDDTSERCGRLEQVGTDTSEGNNLDIVSTHCIPTEDDRELISLIVVDRPRMSVQEDVRCESRWRCFPSRSRHDQLLTGIIQAFSLQDLDIPTALRTSYIAKPLATI